MNEDLGDAPGNLWRKSWMVEKSPGWGGRREKQVQGELKGNSYGGGGELMRRSNCLFFPFTVIIGLLFGIMETSQT